MHPLYINSLAEGELWMRFNSFALGHLTFSNRSLDLRKRRYSLLLSDPHGRFNLVKTLCTILRLIS